MGFLFAVTVMPLSTHLLAEFITYRAAIGIYWLNIFVLGATLYWSWGHATRAGLIKPDISPAIVASICRRILIAQSLYAAGALLCFVNTWASLAAIVCVQLNYAIAPRLWWKRDEQPAGN
jgi:uncharacterized membrane protein